MTREIRVERRGARGANAAEVLYVARDENGDRLLPAPTAAALNEKLMALPREGRELIDSAITDLGVATALEFAKVDDKLDVVDATVASKVSEVNAAVSEAGIATSAASTAAGNAQAQADAIGDISEAVAATGANRAAAEEAAGRTFYPNAEANLAWALDDEKTGKFYIGQDLQTFELLGPAGMIPLRLLARAITDRLIPQGLGMSAMRPETGYLYGTVDPATDKVLFGLTTQFKLAGRSGMVERQLLDPTVLSALLPSGVEFGTSAPEAGWALMIPTIDGRAAGFRSDGTVAGKVALTEPVRPELLQARRAGGLVPLLSTAARIVILGDSLADGAGASGFAAKWHTRLAAALGIPAINLGIGGQNAEQIAARFDAVQVTVTMPGNFVPADTAPVTIGTASAFNIDLLFGSGTGTRTCPLIIRGVPGTLIKTGGTTYSWSRSAAGAAVAITINEPVSTGLGTLYANDILIVSAGTNDRSAAAIYPAMQRVFAIVRKLQPYFRAVLVASPRGLTGTDLPNTAAAKNVLAMERMGRRVLGERYLELRRFMIDDALGLLGLTPTADDLADIANDTIPRQLLADLLHSNDLGQQAEAAFYQMALQGRGYVA